MKLNPPQTAPRDFTLFLADFGYPWLLPTMWNPVDSKWVVATIQTGLFNGEYNDNYFESDREESDALLGWVGMPKISTRRVVSLITETEPVRHGPEPLGIDEGEPE